MKRFDLAIAVALIPLDFFTLMGAAMAAYYLRFETIVTQYRPVLFELPLRGYMEAVYPVVFVWLLIFAASGLYGFKQARSYLRQLKHIVISSLIGFAAITVLVFLRGELFNSRFIVLAATVFAIAFVAIERGVVLVVRNYLYRYGYGASNVILVGNDRTTDTLRHLLRVQPRFGLRVVEHIKQVDEQTLERLAETLPSLQADILLQSSVMLARDESEDLLDFARVNHLDFHYVADLFDTKASNADISTIGDIPVIEIRQTRLEGWGRIYKRTFDLIAGTLLLLLALPVMLVIAIAIKLDSRGPVIYKNERVGKNGKSFYLYKFRRFKQEFNTGNAYDRDGKASEKESELIKTQSHRQGPLYKISNDPRNTRVGAFIEKTSLDELPQFFNVLLGNMSLVGPRPHQPREVARYQRHHKRVMAIKPGVTGISQISGRSDLDFEEEVRLDTYYIENWSLRLDISLLLKTPFALLKKHR